MYGRRTVGEEAEAMHVDLEARVLTSDSHDVVHLRAVREQTDANS